MAIEVKMPRLSDTMEQGTVVRWAVKPGQKVKSGDVIADIETEARHGLTQQDIGIDQQAVEIEHVDVTDNR